MTDAPPIANSEYRPQYPATPMPNDDEDDDEAVDVQQFKYPATAILIFCIGVCIGHLITVWTLRADVTILLEYQKEQSLQYQHISTMLESKQQLQWQIVPALK